MSEKYIRYQGKLPTYFIRGRTVLYSGGIVTLKKFVEFFVNQHNEYKRSLL